MNKKTDAKITIYIEKYFNFLPMTSFLSNHKPKIPTINAAKKPEIVNLFNSILLICSIPAPKVTGKLIRKEYFKASDLERPTSKAANKVIPLLEIPGNKAKA